MHACLRGNKAFSKGDRKLALFAMIAYHLQFLFGIILYFASAKVVFVEGMMKNSVLRFFALEHGLMMVIAFVLITMGFSKAKKKDNDKAKFKTLAIFYTIALVVILAAIPWPFREALGGKWF
jgi:NADH:ubiquinone oxidoreductase subunit 2 (subunit N)